MKNWLEKFLSRLSDLCALSIAAYTLIYLLIKSGILNSPLLLASETFNLLPKPIILILLGIIGFSLPLFLKKHNCYNINHTVINDLKHPPIYIASFAVIVLGITINRDLLYLFHIQFISAFTFGVLACLILMMIRTTKITENSATTVFDIDSWIETEEPIKNYLNDQIDHLVYKDRIVKLFKDNPHKSHQITIVGEYGSGKSSLCKLIEESLNSDYIFCYVDGWGREHKNCAGQILEIIIEKLAEYADCSSLAQTPSAYSKALNSQLSSITTPGLTAIGELFLPLKKSEPVAQLHKIDQLLMKLDKKMIVVLEDFDRSADDGALPSELTSLIDRSKTLRHLNFLNALTKVAAPDSLSRITSHYEYLPALHDHYIKKIFMLFIAKRKSTDKKIIFPYSQLDAYKAPEGISELASTLRSLKIALRRTKSAWESNLKGEIDIVDLFHFNILRHKIPGIESQLHQMVTDEKWSFKNIPESQLSTTEKAANNLIKSFIKNSQNRQKIQNIKYLNRAISEHIPEAESKDQIVLNWIFSSEPNKISSELKNYDDDKYSNYLHNFIHWIMSNEDIRNNQAGKLEQLIKLESRNFPKSVPQLFNNFKESDSKFDKRQLNSIYSILEIFEYKLETKSNAKEKIKAIYRNLLENHTSSAILTIQIKTNKSGIIEPTFDPKIIKEVFDEFSLKEIFQKIDPMHTDALHRIYLLYSMTNEINSTQKTSIFFEKGLEISNKNIPMIIYHFDKDKTYPENKEQWNFLDKEALKKAILEFSINPYEKFQLEEKLKEILKLWKKNAENDFKNIFTYHP